MDIGSYDHIKETGPRHCQGDPGRVNIPQDKERNDGKNGRGKVAHPVGRFGVAKCGELQCDHDKDRYLEKHTDRTPYKDILFGFKHQRCKDNQAIQTNSP